MRLAIAAALLLGMSSFSLACPGQTGKTLFSDDFSDDSGGWDTDAAGKYVSKAFQFTAGGKLANDSSLNTTFNGVEGDYCVEIAFPSEPPEAGNPDDAGIMFLASDYDNRYSMAINSSGIGWVNRKVKGVMSYPTGDFKIPAIKTEPGSVNALRVVVKDQKLTFYVNGEQVKVLRAQIDPAANRFGFWAGSDKSPPQKERLFLVKSFSLNEAP